MIVTKDTRYADFEQANKYVSDKSAKELKAAAERVFVGMYDLTLAQFLACAAGEFVGVLGDLSDPTVLQVYWSRRFEDFVKEFAETLKGLQIPLTAEQQRAATGLPKSSFAESMLVFVRGYFGLRSFREAEKITIGEIVIAKRDAYTTAMFDRKLQRIQLEKMKRKK